MNKLCLVFALWMLFGLAACSADEDKGPTELEKVQKEIADEAVSAMKAPIERAKRVKEMHEVHSEQIENAVKEQ